MKLAFISDIHGNKPALEAVLEDIKKRDIPEIVCLGDIVGYGPEPAECIRLVRKHCSTVLAGNHEIIAARKYDENAMSAFASVMMRWTVKRLTQEDLDYFSGLPYQARFGPILAAHGRPAEDADDVDAVVDYLELEAFGLRSVVLDVLNAKNADLAVFGHLHKSYVICGNRLVYSSLNVHDNSQDVCVCRQKSMLVCIPSVGLSRERNKKAGYAIIDDEKVEFVRLVYDVGRVEAFVKNKEHPEPARYLHYLKS
jgi:predicted phosphodiesterase